MAEMYGKVNGCSKGRGGSMHLFDAELNFFGGNAIVGGGLPLAIGLALANKKLSAASDTASTLPVVVCFFGEGAVAEGEFHESLNLAALWQLPVLFVCENNRYAMGTGLGFSESQQNIARKATGYCIKSRQVDGMNVVDVEAATAAALETIRATGKPFFLECLTYRFRGHSMFDTQLYRDKQEVERWEKDDPIQQLINWLRENHQFEDSQLATIESDVNHEIEQAVQIAEEGEWEAVEDMYLDVYSKRDDRG